MDPIDMNKVNLIMKMCHKHFKDHDEYRFACNLSNNEKALLEREYIIEEVDEYSVSKLYKITKRKK